MATPHLLHLLWLFRFPPSGRMIPYLPLPSACTSSVSYFTEDVNISRRTFLAASTLNLPPAHPHHHAHIALSSKTCMSLARGACPPACWPVGFSHSALFLLRPQSPHYWAVPSGQETQCHLRIHILHHHASLQFFKSKIAQEQLSWAPPTLGLLPQALHLFLARTHVCVQPCLMGGQAALCTT